MVEKTTRNLIDAILTTILVFLSGLGHAQLLSWSAVDTDVKNQPILSTDVYYKLYYSYDNTEPYSFASDHGDNFVDITGAPPACYYLRVTAVRTDSEPELESAPSNSVFACIGSVDEQLGIPNTPETITIE